MSLQCWTPRGQLFGICPPGTGTGTIRGSRRRVQTDRTEGKLALAGDGQGMGEECTGRKGHTETPRGDGFAHELDRGEGFKGIRTT